MIPSPRTTLSQDDLERFQALLLERTGLEFPPSRLLDLERGILRATVAAGIPDPSVLYAGVAAADPACAGALIAEVTVGETYFFRNRPQIEALLHVILPDVIERRRSARRLRLWSAGCASGEEPYSLAILLAQLLPDIAAWDVSILATDLNSAALDRGRRGVYKAWSFREPLAGNWARHFVERGSNLEVGASIRSLVRFEQLNLAEATYPSERSATSQLDLIVCRNVLMYLERSTIRAIADRLARSLSEGGWLVAGPAELPSHLPDGLVAHRLPHAMVYQRRAALPESTSAKTSGPLMVRGPFPIQLRGRAPSRRGEHRGRGATPAVDGSAGASPAPDTTLLSPLERAKSLASTGKLEDAETWVGVALAENPMLASAHYVRALILLEGSRPDEAMSALRRCLYADPGFALAHVAVATLLERGGDAKRAGKALDHAVAALSLAKPDDLVDEGDGLTAGGLLDFVAEQRRAVDHLNSVGSG